MGPNVLVGCECSGKVREALRRRGINAWSCDTQPAEDGSEWHIHDDVLLHLETAPNGMPWDGAIFHTPCTRLTNAGVRWLKVPPPGRTLDEMWQEFEEGARMYLACRDSGIPRVVMENPVMHRYARIRIQPGPRQIVQPHWFGDPFFKATGFELVNVPPLIRTHFMAVPKKADEPRRHAEWSAVHRESPGPERAKNRSRTYDGIAEALADAMARSLQTNLAQAA